MWLENAAGRRSLLVFAACFVLVVAIVAAKSPEGDSFTNTAPRPIAPFVHAAVDWLVSAQQADGGWGSGQHRNQKERDPHNVVTDPATTAFTALALMRTGHTPVAGRYKDRVRAATEYLVRVVEASAPDGPRITDLTGTQPQQKMGQMIDTAMTTEFLARVLSMLPVEHELHASVDAALDKCLAKLQGTMLADGTWSGAGWAGVLQTARGFVALELADAVGKPVDTAALERIRTSQARNFDLETGSARASDDAGVELYAFSGAQRVVAARAAAAEAVALNSGVEVSSGALESVGLPPSQAKALADAHVRMKAQLERIDDEDLLRGFGSNGGEEFMSYLQTAESLVLAGGEEWESWNEKMHARLEKIQHPNGTWSGRHCITSPVFCTATVVQCLTVDQDAALLARIASRAAEVELQQSDR